MKNYPNEAYTPYGGYRGAATAQPLEAPHDVQESSPERYYPPAPGGYQQPYAYQQPGDGYQQQQQHYESQQPYLAPPAGYSSPYERTSMGMRASAAGRHQPCLTLFDV